MKDKKNKKDKNKKNKKDLKAPAVQVPPAAAELSEEDLKSVTGGYDWIKIEASDAASKSF